MQIPPEVIIVPAIALAWVWIIKIISDNRIRRALVEKGVVDENIKYLYATDPASNPQSSLKWGMVLIGVGLALVLNIVFPYQVSEVMAFGLMFLFAGVALVMFYFLIQKRGLGS